VRVGGGNGEINTSYKIMTISKASWSCESLSNTESRDKTCFYETLNFITMVTELLLRSQPYIS
jgi:hypothetical protein